MIKCSCGIDCKGGINVRNDGILIEHGKISGDILIYLDANKVIELIKELKQSLINRIEE